MIKDILTMTRRCFKLSWRNLDLLITALILPVAIMLVFVYVIGGAMQTGTDNYVTYATPGMLLLIVGYCAGTTAVSVNSDLKNGIIDRFCTMPVSRLSILMGQVLASALRNLIALAAVLLTAALIGFRPSATPLEWLLLLAVFLLYVLAITALSLFVGLLVKTPESAGSVGIIFMFLPYFSSAFVPIEAMPGLLQGIARYQPVTPINESIRALLLGGESDSLLLALAWCIAISIAGILASSALFSKKTK